MRSNAIAILLAVVLLLAPALSEAAVSRRAILVMDADTGQILKQESAYEQRYPASLTKMMTLYLLFDALRKGEVTLNTKFTASKAAASQPQTNISLRPGDKISVEDAIKALVVRSANDVAVVVAEGLGRSTWNFGVMMTNTGRELGMKNSVFRNPHGLPDARQHTTAYDMALLGVALRKDFPQYYHYFTVNVFRYKGRTYTGHNRVIGRFPGVDGIKTGFINASGFNLVTSVKKDGYSLVAVVMGGVSGGSRDNEMVAMLGRTYASLQTNIGKPRMLASAPAPIANPRREAIRLAATSGDPAALEKIQLAQQAQQEREHKQPEPKITADAPVFDVSLNETIATAPISPPVSRPVVTPSIVPMPAPTVKAAPPPAPPKVALRWIAPEPAKKAVPLPPKGTLEYQFAMINAGQGDVGEPPVRTNANSKNWGIQVGAFREERQARDAVRKAFQLIQSDVKDAYITISREGMAAATIHRARLGNFSHEEADSACRKLATNRQPCIAIQMD